MTFKLILFLLILGFAIFAIGVPLVKLMRMLFPPKRDPVAEARMRLEIAQKERDAALLNKQAEKVYSELYEEVLEDDKDERFKKS